MGKRKGATRVPKPPKGYRILSWGTVRKGDLLHHPASGWSSASHYAGDTITPAFAELGVARRARRGRGKSRAPEARAEEERA